MPVSTIQRTTDHHAQRIYDQEAAREIGPGTAAGVIFIGKLDGSMVPVVEPSPEAEDKRQGKVLSWKAVRLNRVHRNGQGKFGRRGGGKRAARVAVCGQSRVRFGNSTPCGGRWHALDGEPGGLPCGTPGSYGVDCFPRCEYLGEAAKVCVPDHPQAWLEVQKDRLKANQVAAVLDSLAPFVQADNDADPVTAGDRYRRNHLDQLDYHGAIQQGLPIGSGEIESVQRYLIQQRLKRPGAWWSPAPIETMLALRLNRANREWEAYWRGVEKRSRVNRPFRRCLTLNHTRRGLHRFIVMLNGRD
jgi:hypothetical protein